MAREAPSVRLNGHGPLPEGEAAGRGQAGAHAGYPGNGDRAGRSHPDAAGRDAVRVQAEHEQGLFVFFFFLGTPRASLESFFFCVSGIPRLFFSFQASWVRRKVRVNVPVVVLLRVVVALLRFLFLSRFA